MTETDRELTMRARAGQREAFDALVERHGPTLFTFLRRVTGRIEDAQDLFQETFLRAFRGLRSLRNPDSFGGWVARIAMNAVQRHFSRSQAELHWIEDADPSDEDVEHGDPLESEERRRTVRAAITRLPDRQRAVVSLRLDMDLSFQEIANILGIREDNARAHHYQALRSLRRMLESNVAETRRSGDLP